MSYQNSSVNVNSQVTDLTTNASLQQTEIDSLKTKVTALETEVATLKTSITTNAADVDKIGEMVGWITNYALLVLLVLLHVPMKCF